MTSHVELELRPSADSGPFFGEGLGSGQVGSPILWRYDVNSPSSMLLSGRSETPKLQFGRRRLTNVLEETVCRSSSLLPDSSYQSRLSSGYFLRPGGLYQCHFHRPGGRIEYVRTVDPERSRADSNLERTVSFRWDDRGPGAVPYRT